MGSALESTVLHTTLVFRYCSTGHAIRMEKGVTVPAPPAGINRGEWVNRHRKNAVRPQKRIQRKGQRKRNKYVQQWPTEKHVFYVHESTKKNHFLWWPTDMAPFERHYAKSAKDTVTTKRKTWHARKRQQKTNYSGQQTRFDRNDILSMAPTTTARSHATRAGVGGWLVGARDERAVLLLLRSLGSDCCLGLALMRSLGAPVGFGAAALVAPQFFPFIKIERCFFRGSAQCYSYGGGVTCA